MNRLGLRASGMALLGLVGLLGAYWAVHWREQAGAGNGLTDIPTAPGDTQFNTLMHSIYYPGSGL